MRTFILNLIFAGVVIVASIFALYMRYGGGEPFPDLTTTPVLGMDRLQLVADVEWPPGNIAVAPDGRTFFTFHPEASPPAQVVELRDDEPVAYPPKLPEALAYQSVLSIRVDRQERLWVLDDGHYGLGQPRILAFDLASDELVYRYDFPRDIAGIGSNLNDFQVAPDGASIYIADASILAQTPALIVLDVQGRTSRRLLEGDRTVVPELYVPVVGGRRMELFGIFAIRPGVDSIALDRAGEWLYFAPVTQRTLYRIRTEDLNDPMLPATILSERAEPFAAKTMSDGITMDLEGNVYLTDIGASAIVSLSKSRELTTLLKDPKLRWPKGMSFGPDGWLYFTCSALQEVIGRSEEHIRMHAPYQIFRFKPGPPGVPGH